MTAEPNAKRTWWHRLAAEDGGAPGRLPAPRPGQTGLPGGQTGRGRGERGQSLVEFAMVVPLLLLLVFAIIDFGRAFDSWITVTSAAREGARVGAVGADQATIISKVDQAASDLDQSKLTVNVTNAQGAPGSTVSVQVNYAFSFITPIGGLMQLIGGGSLPNGLSLSSTSDMRLE